ncbi:MAG: hypothetical protein ACRDMV_07190 [Streptosporangiales bacterium]
MPDPDNDRSGTKPPSRPDGSGSSQERRRHGSVAIVFACALPVAILVLPTLPALAVAAPVLGIGALVAGILARRAAKTTGGTAYGTTTAIVVGVAGLVMSLTVAPFWQPLSTYQQCRSSAITMTSKRQCQDALQHSIATQVPFAPTGLLQQLQ